MKKMGSCEKQTDGPKNSKGFGGKKSKTRMMPRKLSRKSGRY